MHDKLLSSKKHQQEFKYIYSIIIIAVHLVVCNQGRRNALKHRLAQNFQKAPRGHKNRNLAGS